MTYSKTPELININVVPTSTVNYSLADSVRLDDIVNDSKNLWLYSDASSSCLLGSAHFVNSNDELFWGWVRNKDNQYTSEPINPGEGPTWQVKQIYGVRWLAEKGMCRVGIEMDLSENAQTPRHVWYVLDFQHSFVEGQIFNEKPETWSLLSPGTKLR
jgi:hypothetical protein